MDSAIYPLKNWGQGPVSRKSRNFSGTSRLTQFSLYLQNEGVSRHKTLQLLLFLFPLQHMKRPALHNKQVGVLRMAFRARKVLTFPYYWHCMPLICYWRVDTKQKENVKNNHVGEPHNIIKNSPLNTTTKPARIYVEEALVSFDVIQPENKVCLASLVSRFALHLPKGSKK